MSISSEAWAIVLATFIGPIAAVAITLWRDAARSKYGQRLYVFRALMATRRVAISQEHVTALNLVEVDFYGEPKVESAWKTYKDHLGTGPENAEWHEKRDRLLAHLLYEMASRLGFKIPALDIFRGGYAPDGWAFRDQRQTGALEFVNELREGKRVLPVWVAGPSAAEQPTPPEPRP
jgi:hypothetical protein